MRKFAGQSLVTAFAALVCLPAFGGAPAAESVPLVAGIKAPDFTRVTSAGKKISLKQFRGRPVILFFYPKDESSECTKEACGFKDYLGDLKDSKNSKAEIIGVSGDSDETHKAFASHYSLPFDLISDSDNTLLLLYQVPLFKGGLHKRVTFVINKHGYITDTIYYSNEGAVHVNDASAAVQRLGKN